MAHQFFCHHVSPSNLAESQYPSQEEGMVAEKKRKKTKMFFLSFWYPIQGLGQMAHAPQAGTGDSMS